MPAKTNVDFLSLPAFRYLVNSMQGIKLCFSVQLENKLKNIEVEKNTVAGKAV